MKIKHLKAVVFGGTEPKRRDRFQIQVKSLTKHLAEKRQRRAKAYGV